MSAAGAAGYIHGTSRAEQDRLHAQARQLEAMVFEGVDFTGRRRLLEVGCGAGAQTKLLLERFPGLAIAAVDASPAQVERARAELAGRVEVTLADARRLPYADASFDAAFLCWVLEHMARPLEVLREVRRALAPGAVVYGIEVFNASLHLEPDCPSVRAYWERLNRRQSAAGGDPEVGAKLGNLLLEAGFKDVVTSVWPRHHDQRDRAALASQLDYWRTLMLSAEPELRRAGLADDSLVAGLEREFEGLKTDPRSVFYYTPVKFSARRP